jgi:hypothetical protein
VPGDVVARRIDSLAIEVEMPSKKPRCFPDQHVCADATDDIGTERAPQSKPEQNNEDACGVRSDLV